MQDEGSQKETDGDRDGKRQPTGPDIPDGLNLEVHRLVRWGALAHFSSTTNTSVRCWVLEPFRNPSVFSQSEVNT